MKRSRTKPRKNSKPARHNHKVTGLTYYRIRRNLTLRDIGEMTGLSTATLHRLERRLIQPSERSRIHLMDGLGLNAREVDKLLREVAEMPPAKGKKRLFSGLP